MEQRCAARSRAAGLKAADLPVLATESGKKCWEFRLSSVATPAFVRVCEDSMAEDVPLNALPPRLSRAIGGKEQMIG